MKKKFLALLLVVVMVFAMVPVTSFSEKTDIYELIIEGVLDLVAYEVTLLYDSQSFYYEYIEVEDLGGGKLAFTVPNPFNFPGITLGYRAFSVDPNRTPPITEIQIVALNNANSLQFIITEDTVDGEIFIVAIDISCVDCGQEVSKCVCVKEVAISSNIINASARIMLWEKKEITFMCGTVMPISNKDVDNLMLVIINKIPPVSEVNDFFKRYIEYNKDSYDVYDIIEGVDDLRIYEVELLYDVGTALDILQIVDIGDNLLAITIPNPFDSSESLLRYRAFHDNGLLVNEIKNVYVISNNTIQFIITGNQLGEIWLIAYTVCEMCGQVACECDPKEDDPSVCANCGQEVCECEPEEDDPSVCANCVQEVCECEPEEDDPSVCTNLGGHEWYYLTLMFKMTEEGSVVTGFTRICVFCSFKQTYGEAVGVACDFCLYINCKCSLLAVGTTGFIEGAVVHVIASIAAGSTVYDKNGNPITVDDPNNLKTEVSKLPPPSDDEKVKFFNALKKYSQDHQGNQNQQ